MIVLDQFQREVYARRYTGRCVEGPIFDINHIGNNTGSWKTVGKFACMLPMRRHGAVVEQSGGAKKESAGADRAVAASLRRMMPQPVMQPGCCIGLMIFGRACDEQRIDLLNFVAIEASATSVIPPAFTVLSGAVETSRIS